MRSHIQRIKKYGAKVSGIMHDFQPAHFGTSVEAQVAAERYVKTLGVPLILLPYYIIFAKQVIKIMNTHKGDVGQHEVCHLHRHWWDRGLDPDVLNTVVQHYNLQPCVSCDWLYFRRLTFTGNVSGTNLDNFPVLVHLTNANFDFNKARDNGEDIRFMDVHVCPSEGTPLDHEIELWDKPGTNAWIWVKVPRIDAGSVTDFIDMYYGNASAADGQNVAAVWSNGYLAVMHMKGNGTTLLPDSLAAYNFTKRAIGEPANVATKIDGCQLFDGNNDNAKQLTLLDTMPSALVITFWLKPTNGWSSAMGANEYFMDKRNTAINWLNMLFDQLTGKMQTENRRAGVTTTLLTVKVTWLAQFYHISFHYGTGGMKIYVDGSLDNSNAVATVPLNGSTTDYYIGSHSVPGAFCDCSIDEYRVSSVTRSADWIMGQYKSQTETLITYGAEEGV